MLVRGPCPHDNIHIRIKQLIQLLVRDPCPHDNIHHIYYNFKTGILTYFLKAFEFHLHAISAYHHITLWVWIALKRGVLDTKLCDEVCQLLVVVRWFSPGTPVSSTSKSDLHDITKILLKVALNTIKQTNKRKY
jgi:hypothetical protein